nr:hypothetical protein [uncultured Draconibacterium sp.]
MRIRKLLIVLFILVFTSSISNARTIEHEMKNFMLKTLKENFGNKSDVELITSFLSEYLKKNGTLELEVDERKLKSINKYLLQDRIYFKYYPMLVFASSNQEFENEVDEVSEPKIIFDGGRDIPITKMGIYINSDYLTQIKEDNENDAVNKILEYHRNTGVVSYFIVADSFLKCNTCIDNSLDFIAVLFWKYFCDLGGSSFYKQK